MHEQQLQAPSHMRLLLGSQWVVRPVKTQTEEVSLGAQRTLMSGILDLTISYQSWLCDSQWKPAAPSTPSHQHDEPSTPALEPQSGIRARASRALSDGKRAQPTHPAAEC